MIVLFLSLFFLFKGRLLFFFFFSGDEERGGEDELDLSTFAYTCVAPPSLQHHKIQTAPKKKGERERGVIPTQTEEGDKKTSPCFCLEERDTILHSKRKEEGTNKRANKQTNKTKQQQQQQKEAVVHSYALCYSLHSSTKSKRTHMQIRCLMSGSFSCCFLIEFSYHSAFFLLPLTSLLFLQ